MTNNGIENQKIKLFSYTYKHYSGAEKTFTYPIRIPYKGNLNELCHQIVECKMDPVMDMIDADIGNYYHAHLHLSNRKFS